MRLRDIVRAPKAEVHWGEWKSGPNKPGDFPVQRSGKSLQFGSGYRTRVVSFAALGRKFRVLCAICEAKQSFYAAMGENVGKDTRVLACYEFHASHPGWHAHVACQEVDAVPFGRARGPHMKRVQSKRRLVFAINEDKASDLVNKVFGLRRGSGAIL